MKKVILFLQSSLFRFRISLTAILTFFSVCPCCGKQGCPTGIAFTAFLSSLLVFLGKFVDLIKSWYKFSMNKLLRNKT